MPPALAIILAALLGLGLGFYAGTKCAMWVLRRAVVRLDQLHRDWGYIAADRIRQLGGAPPPPLPCLHDLGRSMAPAVKNEVVAEAEAWFDRKQKP